MVVRSKLSLLLVALSMAFTIDLFAQAPVGAMRTEEYAIISVYQYGKRNYMSITIGSASTEEKEYEKQKNIKKFDMAPVIREMEKLNALGYELMDHNSAILPSGTDLGGGSPFYSFVFRKRIGK